MSNIIGKCPSCGKGDIIENDLHYQCNYFKSQEDKCTLTIWKSFHGIQLTEDIVKQLIENKKTGLIDMVSKENKPFQASIIITESATVDLSFDTVYLEDIECPACNGKIVETSKSYICEDYFEQKCNVKINKVIAGVELTIDQIRTLLKGENTEFIEGFKGNNSLFNAKLYIDPESYEVKFDSSVTDCPKCKGGKLKEFEKSYSCSNYKSDQSCEFSVWKYQYGGTVSKKNLIELCSKKETKPIDFKTKDGNHPYKGKLILSDSFVVSMEKLEKV
jgi:transcription initiation factor IIE alpha subunit